MSNRDSLGFGDLLPQDVVEVFAQERHNKRGRKKRNRSLRRAFSWLKGKKRKNLTTNGQGLGLGPALDLALDGHPAGHQGHKGGQKSGKQAHPQGNSHAVPKRDDDKTTAPPMFQENVFIETSRPKYLEDLHTEALEGLKMMLQEETSNGVEFQDNESTISAMTVQTDGEGGGFVTDSTIPDSSSVVSMQSSASIRSSRSGLTRQGSTFRPLNSGKKSEKTKTRRRHRRTVVGIPKHVQRELGLDRSGWTLTPALDEEQLHNGETEIRPTTDRPQHAAESAKEVRDSPQATDIIQPLSKDKVEQLGATHAGHRDDLALLHCLGPDLEIGQRPHSLAVPWMTTGSSHQQHLLSPVISMSPQAPHLSKILPNAVLPPSIEVVEISRGRSRNSVRTVSKSSLKLSSPAPSRASSRASSTRTTSSNITSASRYYVPTVSDSSCWSNSASSETLVSDSSTISSSSTPRQKRSQYEDSSAVEDKVISSTCTSNGTSKNKINIKEEKVKKDGQFVRSLSVMKSKRAPPPPSRSYSLHSKMKRRSRDLAEDRVIPGESSPDNASTLSEENEKNKVRSSPLPCVSVDSPGYHADTSSLEDSAGSGSLFLMKSQLAEPKAGDVKDNAETVSKEASQEKQEPLKGNKLNKIVSPSSGYSSQDGASPQTSKQPYSSSPKHKKGFFAKLQKLFPGSSPPGSDPSSPSQIEFSKNTKITEESKPGFVDTVSVSPSVRTLRELFNIPPPPKVHAPPPPPPEVWAHNKRTFELLLGPPAPDNTYAIIKKNPKDRRQQRQSPSVSTEGSVKMERKHRNPTVTVESVNGSLNVLQAMKVQENGTLNTDIHKENNEKLAQNGDLKVDEKVRVCEMLNGMLVKAVEKREETLVAVKREEGQKTSTQATEVETKTDSIPSISLAHISPSPSLPRQPLTTKPTEVLSVQIVSHESSWPPPPPPMAQVGISGPDEIDLPLPPPPLFGEVVQVLPSAAVSGKPQVKAGGVKVITGAEPKKLHASKEVMSSTLNIPPPPPYTAPPPPTTAAVPPTTKNISSPPPSSRPKESAAPIVQDVTQVKEAQSPIVEVSPLPPEDLTPPIQEASQSAEEAAPESKFMVPQSIPPPPPLPSQLHPSEQIDTQDSTPLESEMNKDSTNSILTAPQSIPPPPPIEPLHLSINSQTVENPETETPPSPPSEFRNSPSPQETEEPAPSPPISIPLPPPLPVDSLVSTEPKSSPLSTENQSQMQTSAPFEPTPIITPLLLQMVKLRSVNSSPEPPEAQEEAPAVHEEPTPIVTPSLLQMVKLRSVNSSPEPPEAQEETPAPVVHEEPTPIVTPSFPQTVKLQFVNNNNPKPPEPQEPSEPEVTMNQQQQSSLVPSSSLNCEVPQKPIRRSLIVTSPTSTFPPVIATLQPTLPKSETVVVPPKPSSTAISSAIKSPPATTASPSMNLQEAIRLRTAARSKEGPASRFSLQSPLSPPDFHKSPTSTASFIFSKSNKKVVIETKQEDKETLQRKTEESKNKGVKVPPPVAKKPKANGKEAETSEGVEQTGQEAEQGSAKDATEEPNGTAGTVGGETSST
ncbi:uncharacterized protein KIAA1522 homolog isoform X2 [Melanotaenia boesemani]|uniref:uncharacterized protein KIAA1522 homolog isoform X2 n=1 Tax=Melanotaenia boesemani TaxID=1250792 RepID=UPI001C03A6EF|nr:uncharacterized protein KIAA1522 homolog isoform X2 [Melanotaenia boesemani]